MRDEQRVARTERLAEAYSLTDGVRPCVRGRGTGVLTWRWLGKSAYTELIHRH